MAYKKLYEDYFEKLANALPMNDDKFTMQLTSHKLLPKDVDKELKSLNSKSAKARLFLQNSIKRSLDSNECNDFESLMMIMEKYGSDDLKKLTAKMRSNLGKNLHNLSVVKCVQL